MLAAAGWNFKKLMAQMKNKESKLFASLFNHIFTLKFASLKLTF